ncbi:MAG TPA: hypothetical protein PKV21_07585 [bacterium]|nr:hypothetical protein [bacterium]
MINTILNKIYTELKKIDYIADVFTYPPENPKGYPYCWIVWEGNESQVLTNYQDRVIITYKITLVQEKLEELKGAKNAEETAEKRCWEIENLLRGLEIENVLRIVPVETIKTYDSNSTRIILEFNIKVELVVDI